MKFDPNKLPETLQSSCPDVVFAPLYGSAKEGHVNAEWKQKNVHSFLLITDNG